MPSYPANTEILNGLRTITPFQSFQRGQTVLCKAWRSPSKQLFRNAWSVRHIISSSHRLRARCSVGVKRQSLSVTFLGATMIYTSQESGLKRFSQVTSPDLCCWRAWFCNLWSNFHPALTSSRRCEGMGSAQDCWLKVPKRENCQKIPDTASPSQFAEVITGFWLWCIYIFSSPCFCC